MQSDISLSSIINNWSKSDEVQAWYKVYRLCQDIAFWKGKCFQESDIDDLVKQRKKLDQKSVNCTLDKVLLYQSVSIICDST